MRQFLAAGVLVIIITLFAIPPAEARRAASHTSRQSSGTFIIKKCKTAACNKKHPGGTYAIPLHKKKR